MSKYCEEVRILMQKANILIVDHQVESLAALEAVLTPLECNLIVATSGDEALKWVREVDFALILVNLQISDADALKTDKLLIDCQSSPNIPIIFLPGSIEKTFYNILGQVHKHYGQEHDRFLQAFSQVFAKFTEYKTLQNEHPGKLTERRTGKLPSAHEGTYLSGKMFRTIFELSPNMMSIRYLKNGHYILVNTAWERSTGYKLEEVKDRYLDIYRFVDESMQDRPVLYYLSQKPLRDVRITFTTKSGKDRQGMMSTEIYELDGEQYILSVTTDITERLKMEREMARLDRLDLIGQMAAGIAHENRNPMTTVRGFLQMLGTKHKFQEQQEILELMVEELDRANSIITEFLSLSKDIKLKIKMNNLNQVINSIFPLIQADAFNSKKDVCLELGEIPDFPFDEREIRQLILNLAHNGLEAMGADKTLYLRTYSLQDSIVLEVEDQGCGIPSDVLNKLGTPFCTTKENGTGLGLAICYQIVEKHQAKINVKTSPQGTTFRITFPAC